MSDPRGTKRTAEQVFQDALKRSQETATARPSMRLPWESNSWLRSTLPNMKRDEDIMTSMMRRVIGDRVQLPPIVAELAASSSSLKALPRAEENKYSVALAKMMKSRFKAVSKSEDSLRLHAMSRWKVILNEKPSSFKLCRQAVSDFELSGVYELTTVIEDAFASRSTNTLLSRAGPMLRYIAWCRANGLEAFPVQESVAYIFLCYQRKSECAATFPASFSSAINFAKALVGLDGADEVGSSGRINGLAFNQFGKKRLLLQRRPLLIAEVLFLETQLFHDGDLVTACMAGFFILLLNLRARFSDIACVESFTKDLAITSEDALTGYVEFATSRTKTGKSKEKKKMLLPLSGLAVSLKGRDWLERWFKVREAAGIPLRLPLLGDAFMPAPESHFAFSSRAITNAESNAWLRDALATCGLASPDSAGCHSLKATPLSWVAKWASGDRDHALNRKLLGYHSPNNEQSLLIYSRDAMSSPLKLLETVVEDIRLGAFLPDEPRTGRTVHESRRVPIESEYVFPVPDKDEPASLGSASESSDSDSDGDPIEQLSSAEDMRALQGDAGSGGADLSMLEQGFTLWHHRLFLTVHWKLPGVATLACGRGITNAIVPYAGSTEDGLPLCKQCAEHTGVA